MKSFTGIRGDDGVCTVYVDDPSRLGHTRRRLLHRTGLGSHSPTGFEWGYAGSGPAELARAICVEVTGDPKIAPRLYQRFKERIVQNLPHDTWKFTEADVRSCLDALVREEVR